MFFKDFLGAAKLVYKILFIATAPSVQEKMLKKLRKKC